MQALLVGDKLAPFLNLVLGQAVLEQRLGGGQVTVLDSVEDDQLSAVCPSDRVGGEGDHSDYLTGAGGMGMRGLCAGRIVSSVAFSIFRNCICWASSSAAEAT